MYSFFHLLLESEICANENLSIFIWSELIKLNLTSISWPDGNQNEDDDQMKIDTLILGRRGKHKQ